MILFIHGISQQRHAAEPAQLLEKWRDFIRRGLSQIGRQQLHEQLVLDAAMGFYADLSDPGRHKAEVQSQEATRFEVELREELVDQETQAFYNNPLVVGALRTIDRLSLLERSVGSMILRQVAHESIIYLGNPKVRKQVQDRILASVPSGQQVDVIIGHSLGSVIAYDIIASRAITPHGLLTLGSPLGSKAFKRRLVSWRSDALRSIAHWIDLRDPLDVVCFNRIEVKDMVRNYSESPTFLSEEVDNTAPNKHSISGYLPLRATALSVDSILGG